MQLFSAIPVEFVLFALVLLGVATMQQHALRVAAGGFVVIAAWKLSFGTFGGVAGWAGMGRLFAHEWVLLANLFALLMGFAILARHFEQSHLPLLLPKALPDNWTGGLALLVMVFVLSSVLDNIAAAMIGGTMAMSLYKGRVHVGFVAAIVAASNAGGAGSVIGDTTTTMMWIAGVRPGQVVEAYAGAVPALLLLGVAAARQQHALQPIMRDAMPGVRVDTGRLLAVALIIVTAVVANLLVNMSHLAWLAEVPVLGLAVWAAVAASAFWARPDWAVLPATFRSSLFLLLLVSCAAMMPVERLPDASWPTALGLGFLSAVFDNIPLTALALKQGGYDWGFLAYAVGFGGSMMWFGSSAGVALTTVFPQGRSVRLWLVGGWHVALAYAVGFGVLLALVGWHPDAAVR